MATTTRAPIHRSFRLTRGAAAKPPSVRRIVWGTLISVLLCGGVFAISVP